jgi:hypothetical protein
MNLRTRLLAAGALALCLCATASAQEAPSKGQTLYLPIYSHLWHGNVDRAGKADMAQLSALVSIRNTDPNKTLRVVSAKYYDTDGKLLREFLPAVRLVPPLGTLELLVERREAEGGSGANFLIRWQNDEAISPPLVEAVHADLYGLKPVSFITTARPIGTR